MNVQTALNETRKLAIARMVGQVIDHYIEDTSTYNAEYDFDATRLGTRITLKAALKEVAREGKRGEVGARYAETVSGLNDLVRAMDAELETRRLEQCIAIANEVLTIDNATGTALVAA